MHWLLKLLLVLTALLSLLLFWTSTEHYRSSQALTHVLPMTFAHADHAQEQCVSCHHNYQDDTGQGLCIHCHQTDPQVSFLMREQFHDLCMGCHSYKRDEGHNSGPLRNCSACHVTDNRP